MEPWSALYKHWAAGVKGLKPWQPVVLCLYGSQNYQLDTEESDVDSKLIIAPTFKDIAMNKRPTSHELELPNMEHVDIKDVRLMFSSYRKQNINFLETMFTKWQIINPLYQEQWNRVVREREVVARLSVNQALKTMKGMALQKYRAMEHPYPSKLEVLDKFGYDPKQLCHLLRLQDFIPRYIAGEPYQEILRPRDPEYLVSVKQGYYNLDDARVKAAAAANFITTLVDEYIAANSLETNQEASELLDDVQYQVMKIATTKEFEENEEA